MEDPALLCEPKDESSFNVNQQTAIPLFCLVFTQEGKLLGRPRGIAVESDASISDVKKVLTELFQSQRNLNIAVETIKVWRYKRRAILANTPLLQGVLNTINFSDETQVEALSNSQRVEQLQLANAELLLMQVADISLEIASMDYIPRTLLEKGHMKDVFTEFVKRKFLRRIKVYLRDQLLPVWTPPGDLDKPTQDFYDRLAVPNINDKPNLMLHDIVGDDDHRSRSLFRDGNTHRILCNTSGSGKTSLLLKGLSKNWGFYFVTSRDVDRFGATDLEAAIDRMGSELLNETDKHAFERDEAIDSIWALKVLLVRWSAFAAFIEVAREQNGGELPQDIKYQWLLFQSVELTFARTDPFTELIRDFPLYKATIEEIEQVLSEFSPERVLGSAFKSNDTFYLILDQAQVTGRLRVGALPSDRTTWPVLNTIVCAWKRIATGYRLKFIVSGTDFPLIRFRDTLTSSTGDTWDVFCDTGDLSSRVVQKLYMSQYLPPTYLLSTSGKKLLTRVFKWLRGRYSFAALFIQLLLINNWTATGPCSPHKVLNAFVHYNAGFFPTDYDNSALALEPDIPDPYICCFLWEKLQSKALKKQLSASLDTYQSKHTYPMWRDENEELVEYGFARFPAELGETFIVQIREPMVLAGIQYFLKVGEGEFNTRKRNQSVTRYAWTTAFTSECPPTVPYHPALVFSSAG